MILHFFNYSGDLGTRNLRPPRSSADWIARLKADEDTSKERKCFQRSRFSETVYKINLILHNVSNFQNSTTNLQIIEILPQYLARIKSKSKYKCPPHIQRNAHLIFSWCEESPIVASSSRGHVVINVRVPPVLYSPCYIQNGKELVELAHTKLT